jgi:uridine kinase
MQDSFYKTLDEEGSRKAFRNEYDFDSPDAIDFDVLVDRLRDLKAGYAIVFFFPPKPCVD